MAKNKNRDKVAGPDDLTVHGLCVLSHDSYAPGNRRASDILMDMISVSIDWQHHVFTGSDGYTFTAAKFLEDFARATPVTRTLARYITPLVLTRAVTNPLGDRTITRFADPKLDFDLVKGPLLDERLDFGCSCC